MQYKWQVSFFFVFCFAKIFLNSSITNKVISIVTFCTSENVLSHLKVVLSSALESAGLCILVFKTLASGSAASGVSAMQIGFVLPILYHLKKGNRDIRCFRPAVFFSLLCALGGTGVVIYIYVKNSAEVWSLVGIVLVFIAWLPSFQKKMFSPVKSTDIEPKQRVPRGSINRSNTSRSYLHGQSLSSEYSSFKSTYRSIISDIPSPKPDPISEVPCDKTTAWKVLLISSFTKIIFIFGVSSLLPLFLMRDMKVKDIWDKGWDWGIDNMFVLFIVHTSSGIVAYVTGVFACHTCMDRGAFVVPLILSSPLSVVLLVVSSSCDWFKNYSEVSVDFCVSGSSSLVLSIVAMLCTSIALILVFGRVLWNVNKLVLQKETQVCHHHHHHQQQQHRRRYFSCCWCCIIVIIRTAANNIHKLRSSILSNKSSSIIQEF